MNHRIIALAVMLSVINLLHAQSPYNFTYDWRAEMAKYNKPIEYKPGQNVKEISFSIVKHHKTKKYIKEFNGTGKVTAYYELDKNGDRQPVWKFYYNATDKLIKTEAFKHGQLKYTAIYDLNEKGNRLQQEKTNSSSKTVFKNVWNYDANGCIMESIRYKTGGADVKNKWVYENTANCKVAKSTLYNSKGKVVQLWTYDCNQEGEQLEKKKNETQVCKWEKTSDSTLTKVYQTFDEKGKTVKNVSKYLLPDTLILEWAEYDKNNKLTYKETYNKGVDKPLTKQFYHKGDFLSEWKYDYKDGLLASKTFVFKGRVNQKNLYSYNTDKLLAELKTIGKKDKPYQVATLDYVK